MKKMKEILYTIFSIIIFPAMLVFLALGFIYEHLRMMFGAGSEFAEKKIDGLGQERNLKEKQNDAGRSN